MYTSCYGHSIRSQVGFAYHDDPNPWDEVFRGRRALPGRPVGLGSVGLFGCATCRAFRVSGFRVYGYHKTNKKTIGFCSLFAMVTQCDHKSTLHTTTTPIPGTKSAHPRLLHTTTTPIPGMKSAHRGTRACKARSKAAALDRALPGRPVGKGWPPNGILRLHQGRDISIARRDPVQRPKAAAQNRRPLHRIEPCQAAQ